MDSLDARVQALKWLSRAAEVSEYGRGRPFRGDANGRSIKVVLSDAEAELVRGHAEREGLSMEEAATALFKARLRSMAYRATGELPIGEVVQFAPGGEEGDDA